jgi:ribosomal protein L7/L12
VGKGEAMTTVLVSGWKPGFQKIEFTKLLRAEFGYSLTQAKGMTDAVMGGNGVEFQVPACEAERIAAAMEGLGAKCNVAVPAQQ